MSGVTNPVLTVRVTPNASHDRITGFDDAGVLHVRVCRPPADGAANKRLVKILAKALGTAKSSITIVRGETSRTKHIRIDTLCADDIRARLEE